MDRSRLLLWLFIVLAILAATLMSAMFGITSRGDSESTRLYFAAGVLAFLAFIFVFAMLIYAFGGDGTTGTADSPGKVIFDSCVKVLPPIATLIIGFYFGAYHASSRQPAAAAVAPATAAPQAPVAPAPAPKAAPASPATAAPAAATAPAAKAAP
jgi:hypothetical protein